MNHRVLLAGCDAATTDTCQSCLVGNGYHVDIANDGLDCWSKLTSEPPAAVVLGGNLKWGGADGVISRLREEWGDSTVPVILIPDQDTPEDAYDAAADPIVARLSIPVRASALMECLGQIERRSPI